MLYYVSSNCNVASFEIVCSPEGFCYDDGFCVSVRVRRYVDVDSSFEVATLQASDLDSALGYLGYFGLDWNVFNDYDSAMLCVRKILEGAQ